MKNLAPNTRLMGLPNGSNVLFSFAHPDDESMTGGLLVAAQKSGLTPHAFYTTDGEASTYGDEAVLRAYGRRREAARALSHYGVQHIRFGGLPDGKLLENHVERLTDKLTRVLKAVPFSAIVTLGSNGFDGHKDHRAAHDAALAAARRHNNNGGAVRLFSLTRDEAGTHYISAEPTVKMAALSEHKTQFDITKSPDHSTGLYGLDETGFWLSADTQRRLAPYWLNHRLEVYQEIDVRGVGQPALVGVTEAVS